LIFVKDLFFEKKNGDEIKMKFIIFFEAT